MNSQPQPDRTIDNNNSQEPSAKVHAVSESSAHARLRRVVRQCMGFSPTLQSGLGVLDDATATALASMLEQLRAQADHSRSRGWVRGFTAGQQF